MKPLAILLAGLLIAASMWLTSPRYQTTGDDRGGLRIDVRTGAVSYCKAVSLTEAPLCTPEGSRSLEQVRADNAAKNAASIKPAPPASQMTPEEIKRRIDEFMANEKPAE
ncbi:hypothetical protein KX729_09235 [Rhizobium sp. XQZ8]|uniref:hypothetical protein n=1 Tax=Rhizobium populisoli TaxID=2859785 RepID=UPI001CA57AFB|nr:hypothetical protein [Rhizobium populisoli]MBW6421622.1 hypothetical protein [Rhizobium populisoli]